MTVEPDAPYQALYRRFRPQRFSDVLGQGHVTRALRAAVRDGKVAHAYLFSGPRGTGKTSTARILAMALNCEAPSDGEPCGVCQSCRAIRAGSSLDVVELDSATNRGIDEMRDLLSRVALGTPGRWKVYIIDEVHQVTSAAASALLKTLEEPPGHVVFVLATTDPQKVLETIRSRTQHFEFRLLGTDVLTSLLSDVAGRADIELSPEAIDVVVRRGHGSARDALSALDQVAAAGSVEDESSSLGDVVEAVIARDPGAVLAAVGSAAQVGLDPRRLATDLLEHLRNGFLASRAPDLVMLSDQARAVVAEQATRLGPAAIVRAMDLIGQAVIDMRDAADPRTTLEVALVRLSAPELDDSRAALLERLERLERSVGAGGGGGARPAPAVGPGGQDGEAETPARAPSAGAIDTGPSGPSDGRAPAGFPPAPPLPGRRAGAAPTSGMPGSERSPGAAPAAGPGAAPSGRTAAGAGREASPEARAAVPGPSPRPAFPPRPAPPGVAASPGDGAAPGRPRPTPAGAGQKPDLPGGPLPSREELTVAWGDRILASLRPAVKVYVASGRFLAADGETALFAVPDRGLLARAEANRAEVEQVLSGHFGRRVPVRFVLDSDAAPAGRPGAPEESARRPPDDDPSTYDWAELEEAPAAVVSPEQRLLDAFPGAEEVQP